MPWWPSGGQLILILRLGIGESGRGVNFNLKFLYHVLRLLYNEKKEFDCEKEDLVRARGGALAHLYIITETNTNHSFMSIALLSIFSFTPHS
jgi:hypothetical protein